MLAHAQPVHPCLPTGRQPGAPAADTLHAAVCLAVSLRAVLSLWPPMQHRPKPGQVGAAGRAGDPAVAIQVLPWT